VRNKGSIIARFGENLPLAPQFRRVRLVCARERSAVESQDGTMQENPFDAAGKRQCASRQAFRRNIGGQPHIPEKAVQLFALAYPAPDAVEVHNFDLAR
jgi:hypothetical protein